MDGLAIHSWQTCAGRVEVDNLKEWQRSQNGHAASADEMARETRDAVMAMPALVEVKNREAAREVQAEALAWREKHERETREHHQRVYGLCGATLVASLVAAGPNAGSLLASVVKMLVGGGP